jgi:hypothetical protein
MRDLWSELARRVRAAEKVESAEVPFGFTDTVLRKLQSARRGGAGLLDDWMAVLRPAVGLAFGTAVVCFLLQYRLEREVPNDSVTQTEAMIQLAVLND